MSDTASMLTDVECWDFLSQETFGRLAYHLLDEVHIVPINYSVHDKKVIFRTAAGSKLLGATMNSDVAFEADRIDGEVATSVVVRGSAEELSDVQSTVAEESGLQPWLDTEKPAVVAITVTEVSGRRYQMHRPWLTRDGR